MTEGELTTILKREARGIKVVAANNKEFLRDNQTVMIEIILHRITTNEVFTLRKPTG